MKLNAFHRSLDKPSVCKHGGTVQYGSVLIVEAGENNQNNQQIKSKVRKGCGQKREDVNDNRATSGFFFPVC